MLNIIFMARFWLDLRGHLRRNHFKLIFSRLFEICGIGIISFCLYLIGVIKWWRMKLGNNFTSIPLYYGWKIVHQSIPAAPSPPPPPGEGHLAFARGWGIGVLANFAPLGAAGIDRYITFIIVDFWHVYPCFIYRSRTPPSKKFGAWVWLKFRSFRQNTC